MADTRDLIGRRIAVVDDEPNIRRTLTMVLEGEGYSVESFDSAESFLPRLERAPLDALILDVRLPGEDGMSVLSRVRERHAEIPVLMISGHASIEDAVRAINQGATDFLEKPLSRERVLVTMRNALDRRALSARVRALEAAEGAADEMLGHSPAIQEVREKIAKVAGTSVRVLVTGESGTGKELVARAVHGASQRANGPFVKVNCAAIPSELIESELFGHERGAFSGAVHTKRGRFELADGGTLLLDEIGDMSLEAQAAVLRVLQSGEVVRVGGEKTMMVDVRVIAATNKDLEEEVRQGNFREDLYFRLSVVPIHTPPLRERGKDVLLLMESYLAHFSSEHAVSPPAHLTPEAADALQRYSFPGNVRELRNLAERLVILAGNPIRLEDLPPPIAYPSAPQAGLGDSTWDFHRYAGMSLRDLREVVDREYIAFKLQETGWNVTRTAEMLGIERTNLHKKIKQLGLKKQ
ncbi:MAG: sigma-54-dependent transcriptional regulator [Myxococcota bacterium]